MTHWEKPSCATPLGDPLTWWDFLLARRDEPCGRTVPEAILKAISWVERVAEFPPKNSAPPTAGWPGRLRIR